MSSDDKTTADNANTDLQVASQEYTLLVDAISNVLKSTGEADNTLVQKQRASIARRDSPSSDA